MKSMITRQRTEEARRLRKVIGDHVPFSMKEPRIKTETVSSTITTLTTKDTPILEIYEISGRSSRPDSR